MDWRTLFLSPEGRIGQKDFWIGVLILFVVWILTPLLHILAPLLWLVLLYPWICVFAKRLHDFGKSGLLIIVPFVVGAFALTLGVVFGGVSVIGTIIAASQGAAQPGAWAAILGGLGIMFVFLAIAALFKFVFILWVGLSTGDAGPNRYGPPPSSVTTRPTPTAA